MNIAHVRAQTRIGSRHLLLLVAIAVYTWWIPVDFRDFQEKSNHAGGSSRITRVCPQSIGDTPISVVLLVRYKLIPGVACTHEVGCSHEHKNSAIHYIDQMRADCSPGLHKDPLMDRETASIASLVQLCDLRAPTRGCQCMGTHEW